MDFLSKLQSKPYGTRVKILWTTVTLAGLILAFLFITNLKTTIDSFEGQNLIKPTNQSPTQTTETSLKFATIERVEQTNDQLKIYFNFNNPTTDILNLSKLSDIRLTTVDQELTPQKVTDRQGDSFVQKILSNTQNFGILYFPKINVKQVTLTFDQMFLEKNPSSTFHQKLELDLEKLNDASNVRD